MRILPLFSLFAAFNASAFAVVPRYEARLFVNGVQTTKVEAGKPQDWRIEIIDTTKGQKVTTFLQRHQKYMHLVIFSEDFSLFTHAHPRYMPVAGDFYLGVNQRDDDPDSVGTAFALAKPGKYTVLVEAQPSVGALVPAPQVIRLNLEAVSDQPQPAIGKLPVFQSFDSACSITTYVADQIFRREPGLEPGKYGDPYRVGVTPAFVHGESGTLVHFHVQVDQFIPTSGSYVPVSKLQPLMGMEGHMLVATLDPQNKAVVDTFHLHAMVHADHPGMMMISYYDRGELLRAGPAQLWIQFKHGDVVRLVPLSVDFDPHLMHRCGGHH